MIQLILDIDGYNIALPESRKNGYSVSNETLSESIQMISGRTVREYRGKVWVVSYQSGYFSTDDMRTLLSACEKGMRQSITCAFLTQDSDELVTSKFIVTKYTRPKFMSSRKVVVDGELVDKPIWLDFSVTLREVKPHA